MSRGLASSSSLGPLVFRRLGGGLHLWADGEAALARLHEIDPARWAVTSLPLADLQCDPALPAFLDPDGRGRLRVDQLVAARDWLFGRLRGRGRLAAREDAVHLEDLDAASPEGSALLRTARRVLAGLQAPDAARISLGDVRRYRALYVHALANGDGIVPPEFLEDQGLAAFARDVMATIGSAPDLSGHPGVGTAHLAAFRERAAAWLAWLEQGRTDPALAPLGPATAEAAALLDALDAKVRQYFLQCDLLHEEPAVAGRFRLDEEAAKGLDVSDPQAVEARLRLSPLAPPRRDGLLPLDAPFNPLWAPRVAALRAVVVGPLLGGSCDALRRTDWEALLARFAPWRAWASARPAEPFDPLGEERVRALLAGDLPARLEAAIATDLAAAPEIASLADLERLLLLHRWILDLTNSITGLGSLHDPLHRPLFEMGSLVLDGRRLDFTVRVADRAAHRKIAADGRIFLVYARLTERDGGAPVMEVAAPVTRGERGRLTVGKRGIFVGRDGRILDAEVVDLIEHSISVAEAIRAPFRRGAEFARKKLADLATAKAPDLQARAQKALADAARPKDAAAAAAPPAAVPAPAAPTPPKGKLLDTSNLPLLLIGGGAAFAALLSAFTYIATQLAKVRLLDLAAVVLTLLSLVVAVSALVGWLKLRARDLAPLLEANGWAVNTRMNVSGRMAALFNRRPPLPAGHRKENPSMAGLLPDEAASRRFSPARVLVLLFVAWVVASLAFYYFLWPQLTLAEDAQAEEEEAIAAARATPAPDPLAGLATSLQGLQPGTTPPSAAAPATPSPTPAPAAP